MAKELTWWKWKGKQLPVLSDEDRQWNVLKKEPLKLATHLLESIRTAKDGKARDYIEASPVRYRAIQGYTGLYRC